MGADVDTPTALVLNAAARTWPKDPSVVMARKLNASLHRAGVTRPVSQITIAEADQTLAVLERIRSGELEPFLRAGGDFEIRRAPAKRATKPRRSWRGSSR